MKSIQQSSPFDHIRQIENGREYWIARDLQELLGYTNWRRFEDAIERAMVSCKIAGQNPEEQFVPSVNLLKRGKYAKQKQVDYHLTRYAAYLVAMNGDPRKEEIAQAQAYFAIKTREAELAPVKKDMNKLWEDRIILDHKHNKLPSNYWSIFREVAAHCWSETFRSVQLMDNALPDGSIGKRWNKYLREYPDKYDMSLIKMYDHVYPDHRGKKPAKVYPVAWLGDFRIWFYDIYQVEFYPTYARTHSINAGKYIESSHQKLSQPLADDEEII